jgi:cytoskeletal protein RodZ
MEDDASRTTLGGTLRQARQGRNMTLEAVATITRISQPVLDSIETDSLGDLPADVYVRGFVRAYCRAIELPEKGPLELLEKALVQRKHAAPTGLGATPEEIGRPMMPVEPLGALGKQKMKILVGVGAVAVLVLIYLLMR